MTSILILNSFMLTGSRAADERELKIVGDVKKALTLSVDDLKEFPQMTIRNVLLLDEKPSCDAPENSRSVSTFKGVMLQELLLSAGMKHIRKWEPGSFIRVLGDDNREVVFSFGEIFYSSIGRSVLVALEKDGKAIRSANGLGELVVSTDLRNGRNIGGIREIRVERVPIEMHAYDDKKKSVVRPPSTVFSLIDHRSGNSKEFSLKDLQVLPAIHFEHAVMVGDCEGFRGVYSFDGPALISVLKVADITECNHDYSRYVVASSEDGFCATFSFGELFNSRLNDNIMVAIQLNGVLLDDSNGIARSVAREDSTGGRSVRQIYKIEVY